MKKNFAANFAQTVDSEILNEEREDFHEFLLTYCYILTNNIYSVKDHIYSNLKRLIRDYTLVVIPGYKNSCAIIPVKGNYLTKM